MTLSPTAAVSVGALGAVVLSAVLTEVCRRAALRYGVTDRPGRAKAHARPTPYLGGVALTLATIVPAAAIATALPVPRATVLVAIAALAVSAIGLADDIAPKGMLSRLVVETIAAAVVVASGVRLTVFGQPAVDGAVTVVWIVLLTNAFNLLDNMDAAAASMGGVTAAALGAALLISGAGALAVAMFCLAGSCAGFLLHNRPPARIFMGDAGSLFLGFAIAVGTVYCAPAGLLPTATVLLLFGFGALVDTALVVVSRRRAKRSWRTGGTDHSAHRLRRLGLSTARVAAVLTAAVTLTGTLGVLVLRGVVPTAYALVVVGAAGVTAVALLLRLPGYPEMNRSVTAERLYQS